MNTTISPSTTTKIWQKIVQEKLEDPKIMVAVMVGGTLLFATIAIAICCSCGWKRRSKTPKKSDQAMEMGRSPSAENNNLTLSSEQRFQSLPGYNQQRPSQQTLELTAVRATGGARSTENTRKKKKKDKKKNRNDFTSLIERPTVTDNSYIKLEVPAPGSEPKSPEPVLNPELEEMAKLITKSVTKTLASINIEPHRIVKQEVLGSGQFGVVYKGELKNENMTSSILVALKTISGGADDERELQEFMDEVLRMKNFRHQNVMDMLGMTIMDQKPYMVMPYMHNGDLKSYLSKPTNVVTVEDLLNISLQVSRGMEYLTAQNIIHGDLAARNVMVGEDITVKVADFGLARHLFQKDYYSLDNTETLRPYRWMAPESIFDKRSTSKSDVWSFGILVWEVMTRGQRPYSEIQTNKEVGDMIQLGHRLACPTYCSSQIYEVMEKCWQIDPANRPNFKQITMLLEFLVSEGGGEYMRPVNASS